MQVSKNVSWIFLFRCKLSEWRALYYISVCRWVEHHKYFCYDLEFFYVLLSVMRGFIQLRKIKYVMMYLYVQAYLYND